MAHDVFISHAHKDINIAKAICEKLESAQIKCWVAERDISAGEDWTAATRKAIGSSRAVVLLLSENANAATHLEREVAHAFYTNRTILPVRLTETPPSRDFLFYLGNVRWLDASKEPVEQSLDALVASVKEMLQKPKVGSNALPPRRTSAKGNTEPFADSWLGGFQASHYRTMEIVKRVSIVAIVLSAIWLVWYVYSERKSEWFPAEDQQHPTRSAPAVARDSAPQGAGAASPPKSEYSYSRFGLWVAAGNGPTPEKTPGTADQPAPAAKTASPTPNVKGESDILESEPKRSAEINPSPPATPLLTPSVPSSGESEASIQPTPLAQSTPSPESRPSAKISPPAELTSEAKSTPTAEPTTSTESTSPAELGPTAKTTPAAEPSPAAESTPASERTASTESTSPAEIGPTAKTTPAAEPSPAAESTPTAQSTPPLATSGTGTAPSTESAPAAKASPAAESTPLAKSTPAFEATPLAKSDSLAKSTSSNGSSGPAPEAGDGSGPGLEQQSLKELVLLYMRTVASNDDSVQERFFARRVNFFGKGILSISMVRTSMERYRQEWPVRDWEPQGEPEFPKDLHATHPELYEVLQPFVWRVANGSQHKKGSAVLYVRIRRDDQGQLRIMHLELRHRGENDSP